MKKTILFLSVILGITTATNTYAQKNDSTNQKCKFPVWKTIKVGGKKDKNQLIKDLNKEGTEITDLVIEAINQESFKVSSKKRKVKLALVTVDQLGFTSENFSMHAFYKKAEECGLKLCDPELFLYLTKDLYSFKERDWIFFGMDIIDCGKGISGIFISVVRKNDGFKVATMMDENGNIADTTAFIDKNGKLTTDVRNNDGRIYYTIDLSRDPSFSLYPHKIKINFMWIFEIKD